MDRQSRAESHRQKRVIKEAKDFEETWLHVHQLLSSAEFTRLQKRRPKP